MNDFPSNFNASHLQKMMVENKVKALESDMANIRQAIVNGARCLVKSFYHCNYTFPTSSSENQRKACYSEVKESLKARGLTVAGAWDGSKLKMLVYLGTPSASDMAWQTALKKLNSHSSVKVVPQRRRFTMGSEAKLEVQQVNTLAKRGRKPRPHTLMGRKGRRTKKATVKSVKLEDVFKVPAAFAPVKSPVPSATAALPIEDDDISHLIDQAQTVPLDQGA